MSRFRLTFRQFVEILTANGFVEEPHKRGSHKHYVGTIDGKKCLVVVAYHSIGEIYRLGLWRQVYK